MFVEWWKWLYRTNHGPEGIVTVEPQCDWPDQITFWDLIMELPF